ncbi:MAG: aminotransferase class V-fold PLP-dependent enzyme [Clostridiales bacterium]|jgi:cysteine desulfurase|nr:aminotransferase class V-fold PLP-dependent enzyme [Clostridiales bacterium]
MVYLDFAASCPPDPDALRAFSEVSRNFPGNPNSAHALGRAAKAAIDSSISEIAGLLKILPEEIILTSGATESNNLAVKGVARRYRAHGKHLISSRLEHASMLEPLKELQEEGFEADLCDVLANGLVDLGHLRRLLRKDTILAAFSLVDGSLGALQHLDEIAELLEDYPRCRFLCDITQAVGKIPVDLSRIDLASMSSHKFGGMHGSGILIRKIGVDMKPQISGGISTTPYRSGTPCAALAASTAVALKNALASVDVGKASKLNERIREGLSNYKGFTANSSLESIPHILNFSIAGVSAEELAAELDMRGVCVSARPACCPPGGMDRAVYAATKDKKRSLSSIRLSMSHSTAEEDVEAFLKAFGECMKTIRG